MPPTKLEMGPRARVPKLSADYDPIQANLKWKRKWIKWASRRYGATEAKEKWARLGHERIWKLAYQRTRGRLHPQNAWDMKMMVDMKAAGAL